MNMKPYNILILFIVLPVLFLSNCGPDSKSPVVDLARIVLPDTNGQLVNADHFKGQVIMLNFWATWCPPCQEEIPDFIELQNQYGPRGLTIIGISVDSDPPELVEKFARQYGINYPVLYGGGKGPEIAELLGGFRGIPTTFLLDRQGRMVDKIVGLIPPGQWVSRLDKLI